MKAKDYRTTLEPVWCTGCGDFGVLKGLTQALADLFGDDDLSALPESAHGGHYISFGSAASDIHTVRLSDSRHESKRLCWTHACSVSSAPRPFQ